MPTENTVSLSYISRYHIHMFAAIMLLKWDGTIMILDILAYFKIMSPLIWPEKKKIFFFFFWPYPWHVEVPRPGPNPCHSSDSSQCSDSSGSLSRSIKRELHRPGLFLFFVSLFMATITCKAKYSKKKQYKMWGSWLGFHLYSQ